MACFKPTYLYIKRHSLTGKCYFGKTTRDPMTYLGSGTVWRRHLKVHGTDNVETIWCKLFDDQEECMSVATIFSEQQDIVNSDIWLNLIPENGIDGQAFGFRHSKEAKEKISEANRNRTPEQRKSQSIRQTGKKHSKKHSNAGKTREKFSDEWKNRISLGTSLAQCGKKQRIVRCPHCGKEGGASTMPRWHFDNCKQMRGN